MKSYKAIGEALLIWSKESKWVWAIFPRLRDRDAFLKGSVEEPDAFSLNTVTISTEVLECYLDDLLDGDVTDAELYISCCRFNSKVFAFFDKLFSKLIMSREGHLNYRRLTFAERVATEIAKRRGLGKGRRIIVKNDPTFSYALGI
jgi:hypothetical protein